MINSTIVRQPKSLVEITSVIPNADIKVEYEEVMKKVVEEFEAPGFRRGKAPREFVEKNIDRDKVVSLVIRNLLPKAYEEAIKTHDLKPIVDPKVELTEPTELQKILESADLKVKITVAEKPAINLKDYKEKIKGETAKEAIWTPDKGTPQEKKPEESKEQVEQKKFVKIVDTLLKTCEVEFADMVVDTEINRLLTQTLEEIKKLGLSLEEYLRNTGKTTENLRSEASERAKSSLKIGFIFDEIARVEKLSVNPTEIEAIIAKIEDAKQKAEAQKNSYQLAPVLLRQKVVDFLMKL
jgi:FKBP-type peptidyl-prolyl cis-trans isomerase (trigger factor)